MPRIDAAMAASLRSTGGWLGKRDIASEAANVKNSFSSWDNCMNAAYCKWPVIVGIVIGSLILLSVVWCIVRCACLGMSCCCQCFSCLACCGECCGCCTPPNRRRHVDEPSYPPGQGYRAPAPMMAGGVGGYEPPKFAQFETGPSGLAVEPKKVSDDALPPMPSWDGAAKKRVMTEENGGVEMGELDHNTGQQVPLMSGAAGMSRANSPGISPAPSPYEHQGQAQDYMGAGGPPGTAPLAAGALGGAAAGAAMGAMAGRGNGRDPYGPPQRTFSPQGNPNMNMNGNGRGYGPPGPPGGPVSPVSPIGGPPGRGQGGFPQQSGSPPYGQSPYPPENYNNQSSPPSGPMHDGYGPPNGPNQGGPIGGFIAAGPGPRGSPQRQYSNDSTRPYNGRSPPPTQQGPYGNNNAMNNNSPNGRSLVMPMPGSNRSPPPQQQQPQPQSRPYPDDNDHYHDRYTNSPPSRGYGRSSPPPPLSAPQGLNRLPSPPVLQPNGQFDFGLSGSTPQPTPNRGPSPPQNNYGAGNGYNRQPSRSPPPQELPGSGAGAPAGGYAGSVAPSYHTVDPYPPAAGPRRSPPQGQGRPPQGGQYPGYRAYAPQR